MDSARPLLLVVSALVNWLISQGIRILLFKLPEIHIWAAIIQQPSIPPHQARYGPSKMLINTLHKKYLAEEQPPPPIVSSDDSNSMEVAGYAEHPSALLTAAVSEHKDQQIEDSSLKELEELFCATCKDVHTSFRNQLVECSDCHLLYHQECHSPAINDADAQSDWQCAKCRSNLLVESVLTSSSSSSSSPTVFAASTKTSSSSSPHSSSGSSKSASHRKSGSGSGGGGGGGGSASKSGSSSSKSGSGGGGGNGSSSGLLSADKRLANMKKKAAKMQKTK